MRYKIAVLITSYNRRAKTLAALRAIDAQKLPEDVSMEVFLLDDNSSDGTRETVQASFPKIRLFCGDGLQFWNGGMRIIFERAIEEDFDHYILLNDDCHIETNAFARLIEGFETLRKSGHESAILVGSFRDPISGALTYGGVVRSSRIHPLKFRKVLPSDQLQECDTFNGNCVLIPRSVVARVGNLSGAFRHAMGDFDYGLRARAAGCSVWTVANFLGTCSSNPISDPCDSRINLAQRWRNFCETKGLPPREWRVMARRHAGVFWPIFAVLPYLHFLLSQFRISISQPSTGR